MFGDTYWIHIIDTIGLLSALRVFSFKNQMFNIFIKFLGCTIMYSRKINSIFSKRLFKIHSLLKIRTSIL